MTQDELFEKVAALLSQASTSKKPLPSLRALRAQIGGGSLSTISEAVKKWQTDQLIAAGDLPAAFTEAEAAAVSAAVWQTVQPILQARIEAAKQDASARASIAMEGAAHLKAAAEEMLAEAASVKRDHARQEKTIADLKLELEKERQAHAAATEAAERLRAELAQAKAERDKALKEAAASEASLETMRKMIPLLDPKNLSGRKPRRA